MSKRKGFGVQCEGPGCRRVAPMYQRSPDRRRRFCSRECAEAKWRLDYLLKHGESYNTAAGRDLRARKKEETQNGR